MVTVAIDAIVDLGRVFDPKNMTVSSDIRSAVRALFEELSHKQLDYLLVGGVAVLSLVEARNTQDVDLLLDPADIARMDWNARVLDRDFGKGSYRGIDVDLLLTTNPLFSEVFRTERTRITFGDLEVPAATREGLLLLKLYALPSLYRQGKLARAALYETDILLLRQGADVDDERLVARLEPHLAKHDIAELAKILCEQRQRVRFKSS